jgi:hypothetical protein
MEASSPSTVTPSADNATDDKTQLFQLDKRRQAMEEEANAIIDELTSSPPPTDDGKTVEPMGISTPLVDEEGYPRADVDVYRARHLRKRLNELKFDHTLIKKKIEETMMQQINSKNEEEEKARKKKKPKPKFDPQTGKWVVSSWDGNVVGVENGHLRRFDSIGKDQEGNIDELEQLAQHMLLDAKSGNNEEEDKTVRIPFAKIESVLANSPASDARLAVGDEICLFGTVDHSNHRGLKAMGDVVKRAFSDGTSIRVIVRRTGTVETTGCSDDMGNLMTLLLTPKQWIGKGLVGCVFSPTI